MNRNAKGILFGMITVLGGSLIAHAGSLEPPPGPPGPTMKTLGEIEPRTPVRNDFDELNPVVITQPGSYYLVEDIYAFPDEHGIEIQSSHVTLDLNGFSVIGNLEVGSRSGIYADAAGNYVNIQVRNGTVRSFSDSGISLDQSSFARVENVRALDNGLDGTGLGIWVGPHARIIDCVAAGNLQTGIAANVGSVITGSIATANQTGISFNGILDSTTAWQNGSTGILGATTSLVIHSTAGQNGGTGILSTTGLQIGNAASDNLTDLDNAGGLSVDNYDGP